MSSANTTATNSKFNNRQSVIDIWNDYCDNFMKTDTRNGSTGNDDLTDNARDREGIILVKKTVSESVTPKSLTSTPSTSSSELPTSFLKSPKKRQRTSADSKSENYVISFPSQLTADEATPLAVDKSDEVGEVIQEWHNYCTVFADKVSKIRNSSIRNDVRFKMEQILYAAGKKEKKKAKTKKNKQHYR